MPGFTFFGIFLALLGTLLISPEFFFGYGGIFSNVKKQAEQQYGDEHGRFGGNEEYEEGKKREYRRYIIRYKKMRAIGLIFIIIGFSLQILGVAQ